MKRKNIFSGLQIKLTASFLLIVVLMIVLGIISYQQASDTILNNYKANAQGTNDAVGLYANSTCESITARVKEFMNNADFKDYYSKYYNDEAKSYTYYKEINASTTDLRSSVKQIYNLFSFGEYGKVVSTVSTAATQPIYNTFLESELGKTFAEQPDLSQTWTVGHPDMDTVLTEKADAYGMSFVSRFIKGNGYTIVDLHRSVTDDIIDQLRFGEGSVSALVSPDGRELFHSKADVKSFEGVFRSSPFIQNALSGEPATVQSEYVTITGNTYLMLYSPIGNTGILLCSAIPEKIILQEVSSLRLIIILFTVIAGIAAMVIGTMISASISLEVKKIQKNIATVANGDFTVKFRTKRKDEFKDLNDSMNRMLLKIRDLFTDMKGFGKEVIRAAEDVSAGTDHILTSTREIGSAIEDVTGGAVNQVENMESGISKMTQLSAGIQSVRENTDQMESVTDQALQSVQAGRDKVSNLAHRTNDTREITRLLVSDIEQVQKQSDNIDSIIISINEIAEETNLLSLNASIEAARAGEHGRGFSVVAEEIRKLADQSKASGTRIQEIVREIQDTTSQTAKTAEETERNMAVQETVLQETIDVFTQISQCVEQLVAGFRDVLNQLENNDAQKDCVMDSMKNISTVSEKTADAAKEVTSTSEKQLDAICVLNEEAELLMNKAKELEESMKRFITE